MHPHKFKINLRIDLCLRCEFYFAATDKHTSDYKETIESTTRLHIPWPPAVQQALASCLHRELTRADNSWQVYGVYACVYLKLLSVQYNMSLVKCFHNYFTYSHTYSTSLASPITLFPPHHDSSSHPFLLLVFLSSLFSSVCPSLFSVSAYLSSWACLCS